MSELSDQQKLFVQEYLLDLNAGQAAKRAGYSDTNGSHYRIGSRLLTNVHVSAAIEKAMAERGQKYGLKADRIVKELMRIAFADQRHVMRWDDERGMVFHPSDDLDDDTAAAIAEVSEKTMPTRHGIKREQRVKMHDKIRALELLGRHLNMFQGAELEGNPVAQMLGMMATGKVSIESIVDYLAQKKDGEK